MKLGVLAGIHEDVVRLKQALEVLRKTGCEVIACLGDIVGYSVPYFGFLKSRDAHQAVQLVKEHCQYVVTGNHDLYAVRKLSSQQKVFEYPPNWYALDWVTRRELAQGRVWLHDDELPAVLSREDEEYLKALPEFLVLIFDGLSLLLSHYAYPDLVGDSVAFDPALPENLRHHLGFMKDNGCTVGVSAHEGGKGTTVYTQGKFHEVGFGCYTLPEDQAVWIQSPWVANGTYANGVLVLHTIERTMEAIPLNSPPHIIPEWVER